MSVKHLIEGDAAEFEVPHTEFEINPWYRIELKRAFPGLPRSKKPIIKDFAPVIREAVIGLGFARLRDPSGKLGWNEDAGMWVLVVELDVQADGPITMTPKLSKMMVH